MGYFPVSHTIVVEGLDEIMCLFLFLGVSILVMLEFVGSYGDCKTEVVRILWGYFTGRNYSTVAFVRCRGASSHTDLTFNFSITYCSPALTGNHYSSYQLFLYQHPQILLLPAPYHHQQQVSHVSSPLQLS